MNDVNIIFKYEDQILRDPLAIGNYTALGTSSSISLNISHGSNKAILDCGLFVSPIKDTYTGTKSKTIDYNKLLWFADMFPDYGLFVNQKITIEGTVYLQSEKRLMDLNRSEQKNIFSGFEIEITHGSPAALGQKRKIVSYDFINSFFTLESDFTDVKSGDKYKIELETDHVFKSKQGSSEEYPIPLLYNAGKINRLEAVDISLKLKIPPFIKEPGHHFFDLNLKYIPEE